MLRHAASRTFFTAAVVSPPKAVAVGLRAILGYRPEEHAKHLVQGVSALRQFPESVVADALAFVDEQVPLGACVDTPNYVTALNSSLATFAEERLGGQLSDAQLDALDDIPESAHFEALSQSLAVAEPLMEVLQVIARGSEECKLTLLADAGPLLQDVITRKFESVWALVSGDIVTSSSLGVPLLHNADAYRSVASSLFVETKHMLFIDTDARSVQTALQAGCVAHHYRGVSLLQEELVRLNLAFKKHPITGKITKKA